MPRSGIDQPGPHLSDQNLFVLHRYDSLTGVPVSQQNLLLEKASILFNIGALYTQIGTRCNRQTQTGLESAVDAFQRAAGVCPPGQPRYSLKPAGCHEWCWFSDPSCKESCLGPLQTHQELMPSKSDKSPGMTPALERLPKSS